jgi:hypothetical protein
MTDAEIKALNEELRYMTDKDIHSVAKVLMKFGFVIVRSGMPKQDYYSL